MADETKSKWKWLWMTLLIGAIGMLIVWGVAGAVVMVRDTNADAREYARAQCACGLLSDDGRTIKCQVCAVKAEP